MNAIHIRPATLDDTESVAELFDAYRQFYGQAPDLALATRFIRERVEKRESTILVAETATQTLAGFCQLYPSFCSVIAAPIFLLYDLYVAPPLRNTGTGRLLMQAAENLAREQGKARLDLTTAKNNHAAQRLYESQGWVRDEVFYAYSKGIP